jgi:hypothetical protein
MGYKLSPTLAKILAKETTTITEKDIKSMCRTITILINRLNKSNSNTVDENRMKQAYMTIMSLR